MAGKPREALVLTEDDRRTREGWAGRRKTAQGLGPAGAHRADVGRRSGGGELASSGSGSPKLSARHAAGDFRDFPDEIDREVEPGLAVHLIRDHLATHKAPGIHKWLVEHPRFELHFTPTYSSRLNQVQRWFAELQRRRLDRGSFCSLDELTCALEQWAWAGRRGVDRQPPVLPDAAVHSGPKRA
jgi:transposase